MNNYISDLSFKEVNELLKYDPETGIITRKKSKGGKMIGSRTGCLQPNGYLRTRINGRLYKTSRIAWLLYYKKWPDGDIDHINHIRDDDRIINLRCTDNAGNMTNKGRYKTNKSGFVGVYWNNRAKKWVAQIGRKGLGYFDCPHKACHIRKLAELRLGYHLNHGQKNARQGMAGKNPHGGRG